jgi:hypothetical protein
MSKQKNNLFSIIWVASPISYDEMRIRHKHQSIHNP